ncbi:MAG: ASPIC/UnbV domain-containing protein, partial [Thermoanaerobaculia bacterium]
PRLWRRVTSSGGYLSAHDPRLLFGLGDDPEIEAVRVRWPGGEEERFEVNVDRYTTLVQGTGSGEDR